MSLNIDTLPFVESPNRRITGSRAIRLVVIHDMEYPEKPTAAEDVAHFFANPAVQASAHICVDNNSAVRCVKDGDVAWAAPGANSDGLQIELAGYGSQSREQWLDPYSNPELHNAAQLVAQWCQRYRIPVVHLSNAQLANGSKGIIGHINASQVYHQSDHTDPGVNFPWDAFIKLVQQYAAGSTGNVTPAQPSALTAGIQKSVHLHPDGYWGPDTDHYVKVVRHGPVGHFNVSILRQAVGESVGTTWSTAEKQKYVATVKALQSNFGVGQTGVWDAATDVAFWKIRSTHYIH